VTSARISYFTTTIQSIPIMDDLPIDMDHPAVKEYLSLVRFVYLFLQQNLVNQWPFFGSRAGCRS
jgi:hypothetical protein